MHIKFSRDVVKFIEIFARLHFFLKINSTKVMSFVCYVRSFNACNCLCINIPRASSTDFINHINTDTCAKLIK